MKTAPQVKPENSEELQLPGDTITENNDASNSKDVVCEVKRGKILNSKYVLSHSNLREESGGVSKVKMQWLIVKLII